METVWEAGQEAGHSLTWDKIISFCPRFPSRIKNSIKEPGRVIPEAVGAALNGWTEEALIPFHIQNANCCSVPQCCGWDGDGSSSLVAPLCRGSLCHPQSQLHASHLGCRRAQKKEERFWWFLILEKMAHSERHSSEYTQDK